MALWLSLSEKAKRRTLDKAALHHEGAVRWYQEPGHADSTNAPVRLKLGRRP